MPTLAAVTVAVALAAIAGPAAAAAAPAPAPDAESRTAAACPGVAPGDPRLGLVAEFNRRRAERGLTALRLSPALCRAAAERALGLARRARLEPDLESLRQLSQIVSRQGYRSARLFEATVHGRESVAALLAALGAEQAEVAAEAVGGDVLDLGLGLSVLEGRPLTVFLFALPAAVVLERRLAPFADLEAMRQGVLEATNRARRAAGRAPLARDPVLDQAAQAHAEAMLGQRFYAHRDPEGRQIRARLAERGHFASTVGENIARGLFSPDEVVQNWLLSSGHRENILSPLFQAIGIGVSHDPRGPEQSVHWVQAFSSAAPAGRATAPAGDPP